MIAKEANFLQFMQGTKQFVIPIYQRTYSWTTRECQQLFNDIMIAGQNNNINGHFIGSVVYIAKGIYQVAGVPQLLVIDGQQRLATLTLLIAAFGKAIEEKGISELTRKKVINYFLINNDEEDEKRFKLLLTQSDRDTLLKIIEEKELNQNISKRIMENYQYFWEQISRSGFDLQKLYNGLKKLIIVDIALDRDHDNPQLIFESLNSTGLDLSQADLIRNYVLMGLDIKEQQKIYNEYWFPMEKSFGHAEYAIMFDRFMRDYLTIKTGRIPNINEVYSNFKLYIQSRNLSMSETMADVYQFSKRFVKLAFQKEADKEINGILSDINALKVDVAYPFLMELYDDYELGVLCRQDFIHALKLIESYVFRRSICGVPTNSLNKTFATISREIDKDNYLDTLSAALLSKDSYRRFPDDEEFRRGITTKDVYNFRTRNYLLTKLENHGHKEKLISIENLTIEHILPQNPDLPKQWKEGLGPSWSEVQSKYLHTLGNLTLTGYNSEMSDRFFLEKRDMPGGFRDSHLQLNKSIAKLDEWNEAAIISRGEEMADIAIKIWQMPTASSAQVKQSISTATIIANVFGSEDLFNVAKELIQGLFDKIGYWAIQKIVSVSYRSDSMISLNIGAWRVLSFNQCGEQIEVSFCVDYSVVAEIPEIIVGKVERFASRWTQNKDIRLVYMFWSPESPLPEKFTSAWYSAVMCAVEAFGNWSSSPYMRYHQPQLMALLTNNDYRENHLTTMRDDIKEVFNLLRRRLLNLDAAVKEEYEQSKIVYKLESDFAGIVPQSNGLRIILNMDYEKIDDPSGVCENISVERNAGTEAIMFEICAVDQLDIGMELIKQSLMQQLDEIS